MAPCPKTCAALSGIAVALTCGLLAGPAAAARGKPVPGTYAGQARNLSATITVSSSSSAALRYSLKRRCRTSHGEISLKRREGRYVGRDAARGRVTSASLKLSADATRFSGTLRERLATKTRLQGRAGAEHRSRCAASRRFTATLARTDAYVPVRAAGHYAGTSENGLPVEFDVDYEPGGNYARVANLRVDVDAECWEDLDGDGQDEVIVARLNGFESKISDDGEFSIQYSEGDETEYDVDGTVGGQGAVVDVLIAGIFDPDGTPNPLGALSCDSWGATYQATRRP